MMLPIYNPYGKRAMDLVLSLILLLLFLPLLMISSSLILIFDGRPIFFKQERIGKNRKRFFILKLRTMDRSKGPLLCLDNDPRVTKLGKILRKYKIDEIPQFINILKGEMSLVGYRPEVPILLKKIPSKYESIFTIKPGITGKGSIEFLEEYKLLPKNKDILYSKYQQDILPCKLKLGYEYSKNITLVGDLKILILTFLSILEIVLRFRLVNNSAAKTYIIKVENRNLARN